MLAPARLNEAVQVEAAAPLVEARRTAAAAAVAPEEIDTLPLNGRNYLDLATLAPNVSRTNLRSTDRFAETSAVPGTGVSVSGQRNLNNSFIVDGLSANDDAADLAGTFFSEEVIREFQVITSGGGAEFGRAGSGTVSIVTRSGANRGFGSAYEFFRGDEMDARNPLSTRKDATTGAVEKDPLRQNQFGLSLGGPLVKDRAFWFGNVERTAARSNRSRHDLAAGGARPQLEPRCLRLARAACDDRGLPDRLRHHQRLRADGPSANGSLAASSALQPLQGLERECAYGRRAQRREPRRRARRHGSNHRPESPVDERVWTGQRGAERSTHAASSAHP